MTEVPNPVRGVPPSEQGLNLDLQELMDEGNIASGASKDVAPVRINASGSTNYLQLR